MPWYARPERLDDDDSASGLIYLRVRYYDPTTAQFVTTDPVVAPTRSPYGYVQGNALNSMDPSGLCDWWGRGL